MALAVRGFRELNQVFKHAPAETRAEIRTEYRTIAEPTRIAAEGLAVRNIERVGLDWSRMKVGVTQKVVYVAPRQRGVRARGLHPRSRPQFGDLLMERAMVPALAANREQIEAHFERMLDRLLSKWGDDG